MNGSPCACWKLRLKVPVQVQAVHQGLIGRQHLVEITLHNLRQWGQLILIKAPWALQDGRRGGLPCVNKGLDGVAPARMTPKPTPAATTTMATTEILTRRITVSSRLGCAGV